MILQEAFTVEPWALRETKLDMDLLAQTESVFALANGHLGMAGRTWTRASRAACPAATSTGCMR